jgi:hypothetical protein
MLSFSPNFFLWELWGRWDAPPYHWFRQASDRQSWVPTTDYCTTVRPCPRQSYTEVERRSTRSWEESAAATQQAAIFPAGKKEQLLARLPVGDQGRQHLNIMTCFHRCWALRCASLLFMFSHWVSYINLLRFTVENWKPLCICKTVAVFLIDIVCKNGVGSFVCSEFAMFLFSDETRHLARPAVFNQSSQTLAAGLCISKWSSRWFIYTCILH